MNRSLINKFLPPLRVENSLKIALPRAGVGADSAAVKKGQGFLVRAQRKDGSWPMTSRPMKPGGAGSKDLVPITHAGSAWGTLGLVATTPKVVVRGK